MKNDKKRAQKSIILSLSIFAACAVLIPVGIFTAINLHADTTTQDNKASTASYAPKQDQHLLDRLRTVARDTSLIDKTTIEYVDNYEDGGQRGEHTNQTGGSSTNWQKVSSITVGRDLSQEEELRTLAHEYLHVVWVQFGNVGKYSNDFVPKLSDQLTSLYNNDQWMQQRMQWYVDHDALSANELFAIYCTESSDAYLSANVLSQCSIYIDRSKLTFVR